MNENALALEIDRPSRRQYLTLNLTSRPESMYHSPPWILRIRTKVGCPIFANHMSRKPLRELQIDDVFLVGVVLNHVAFFILTDRYREVLLIGRESDIREVLGAPEVRLVWVLREDFGCELRGCSDASVSLNQHCCHQS